MNALRVVVMPLRADLVGAARVVEQSAVARAALARSAHASGAVLGPLEKDTDDAPIPSNGWHWSLTHAGSFAAGVACRSPVGVDLARIETRQHEIIPRVASRDELELFGGFTWHGFARIWTAKEAVLKKALCGLSELSRCVVVAVPDDSTIVVAHRDRDHLVRQIVFADHIAAVTFDETHAEVHDARVEWLHALPAETPVASLFAGERE